MILMCERRLAGKPRRSSDFSLLLHGDAYWREIILHHCCIAMLKQGLMSAAEGKKKSFKWAMRFHSLDCSVSGSPDKTKGIRFSTLPCLLPEVINQPSGPKCPCKESAGRTLAEYSAQARQQGCWRSRRQRLEGSASPQMSQCWMEPVHKLLSPDSSGVQAAAGKRQNFLQVSCSQKWAGLGKILALPLTSLLMDGHGFVFFQGSELQVLHPGVSPPDFNAVCQKPSWGEQTSFVYQLCYFYIHFFYLCSTDRNLETVKWQLKLKLQSFRSFAPFINPPRASKSHKPSTAPSGSATFENTLTFIWRSQDQKSRE